MNPKFIFFCQTDEKEFHMLSQVNYHAETEDHRDYVLHVNGDK